ncbi:hypothetical protein L596_002321 [Steinernema carpocapsae]|uniref:Zinc finger Ran-binding domain-containing protein 2 n=1 Tax=Steinernema carpocapsae TaxID=34508 RepID=A0A4U8UNY4_STECR|nr:hypothetical protein L596_002321 [Steinernema carpocapsae]
MSDHGSSESSSSNRRAPLRDGEWACSDSRCSAVNGSSALHCTSCGKEKPRLKKSAVHEIGKDAAEKSKGLFSAVDWVCTRCNNVNWARRDSCNICKTKKSGSIEERTGYGGGFMDRQNIEYKSRQDDDVYDDFGRVKRNKLKTRRSERNESDDDDDKEEKRPRMESEAEESDEDEDLDKYDLGDFDDIQISLPASSDALQRSASPLSDCSCSCSEGGYCSCESDSDQDSGSRGRDPPPHQRSRTPPRDRQEQDEENRGCSWSPVAVGRRKIRG